MNVLGLISSPHDPASRARIIQYGPYFKKQGVDLHCKHFKPLRDANPPGWAQQLKKITGINEWRTTDIVKSIGRTPLLLAQSGFDLIWQNRLLQLHHSFWEKRLRKPVVFDFDDAIWLNEGKKQVEDKLSRAEMVFAGNEYLAGYATKHNKNVKIIPTVVDTDMLFPMHDHSEKCTIGWIGTQSNFQYLESIQSPILAFINSNPDNELMVVSSHRPEFLPAGHPQIIFKEWDGARENEYINQFTAGIMPLPDNEWTRGKCGYKLLQYLSCGKAVIASPTGVNADILRESGAGIPAVTTEDWSRALLAVRKEPAMVTEKGAKGRTYVMEKYSCSAWTTNIISFMKSIV